VLEGILLKPNMVLSGKENPKQASVQEVAEATVRCLKRVVPAAVPGLCFSRAAKPISKRPNI
jgi:Fructose-1,6-bisphosphate aldolase